MTIRPILIAGRWRASHGTATFRAENPAQRTPLEDEYPVSSWQDCDEALDAAWAAASALRGAPAEQLAGFLELYATRIEHNKDALVEMAHLETALPKAPRLAEVELPRTTGQLRQAAAAAREGSWAQPTIDAKANIRSCYGPIGPVAVFGPNNFPFAFGSVSGGDFAAAIAAGNPVIAKANSSHPGTTHLLAEAAAAAAEETDLPSGSVQLIYRTSHADGERLVADPRLGATGYTGSREAGLKLKRAADAAGKPIYLELSSVNPVVVLPGAIQERCESIAGEFASSCLMGTGQMCTNPGLVVLVRGESTEAFIRQVAEKFQSSTPGTLLSKGVESSLKQNLQTLRGAGAELVAGGDGTGGMGYSHPNTLLRVSGRQFLSNPEPLQTEAFGNASLFVVAEDMEQVGNVIEHLEGNLTGCIYSDTRGSDDRDYDRIAPRLRAQVGRLLNDKMPTGVAVSPAMNHGGPFPATGHPGFTAVGIPASMLRFATLQCYDNVRPHRLPLCLQNKNPNGRMWRCVDHQWTQADVPA